MKASEARTLSDSVQRTKYSSVINHIDEKIQEACKSGYYHLRISTFSLIKNSDLSLETIIEILESNDYSVYRYTAFPFDIYIRW